MPAALSLLEMGGEPVKRELLIAYYFPPVAASGAMRPLGFCRNLPAYGWQLRYSRRRLSAYIRHTRLMKLGELVPPTVDVRRVPYTDRLQQILQSRERLRVLFRKTVVQNREKRQLKDQIVPSAGLIAEPGANVKEFLLDWAFAFPDRQCGWYAPAIRQLRQINEKDAPDVIFATGGPWTSFLVGCTLAKQLKRPLVLITAILGTAIRIIHLTLKC